MESKDYQVGKYYKTRKKCFMDDNFHIPAKVSVIFLGFHDENITLMYSTKSIKLLYMGKVYQFKTCYAPCIWLDNLTTTQ